MSCDGQQALEYVEQTIPESIILDLMMPAVDGFDAPVLVLTAKDLTPEDFKRLNANNI